MAPKREALKDCDLGAVVTLDVSVSTPFCI